MSLIPRIVITPGEPAGIGPDLVLTLTEQAWPVELVIMADPALLQQRAAALGKQISLRQYDVSQPAQAQPQGVLTVCPVTLSVPVSAGQLDKRNGHYVLATLQRAAEGCLSGEFAALVTGPVHKGVINEAGVPFSGHTEFFAEQAGVEQVVMMLATEGLRVALATTHPPLASFNDLRPKMRSKPSPLFKVANNTSTSNKEKLFILKTMSSGYSKRTRFNCTESDFTIAFAFDFFTAGERLTFNSAGKSRIYQLPLNDYGRHHLQPFAEKYKSVKGTTLHIAGNGSYTLCKHWEPSKYQEKADMAVFKFIKAAIEKEGCTIEKIYSGGQTGIDLAGIRAGLKLGIPLEITMPKNFLIRNSNGEDIELGSEFGALKYILGQ